MKLVIKNLYKSFEKNEVLKGIDFEFESGKIYALLGRNGAGKTTFFNCINEDIEYEKGEFYLEETKKQKTKEELHSFNVVFLSLIIFFIPQWQGFQRITKTTPNLFLILNISQVNGECH